MFVRLCVHTAMLQIQSYYHASFFMYLQNIKQFVLSEQSTHVYNLQSLVQSSYSVLLSLFSLFEANGINGIFPWLLNLTLEQVAL